MTFVERSLLTTSDSAALGMGWPDFLLRFTRLGQFERFVSIFLFGNCNKLAIWVKLGTARARSAAVFYRRYDARKLYPVMHGHAQSVMIRWPPVAIPWPKGQPEGQVALQGTNTPAQAPASNTGHPWPSSLCHRCGSDPGEFQLPDEIWTSTSPS